MTLRVAICWVGFEPSFGLKPTVRVLLQSDSYKVESNNFDNVYTMSRSVLGLETRQIVNFVKYSKNFTVYPFILTLIFSLKLFWLRKLVVKFN